MIPTVAGRLARKVNSVWSEHAHQAAARRVLDTPPVVPSDDGLVLFSMVGTRALLPYLVAVKSLHGRLGRGRVVVLDDGTLTQADRRVLATHLGDPRIMSVAAIDTGGCPRGGCWERLLTILDMRADNYVIQLDSDTVTLADIPDVIAAVASNRSFTLRGGPDSCLSSFAEVAALHKGSDYLHDAKAHVQLAIESCLTSVSLPMLPNPRYTRGCAGFAGFACDGGRRALAEAFSAEAVRLLGAERWSRWGSEQVTSNLVIANTSDPLLLPYDRYLTFWDQGIPPDARFIHYAGTHRFTGRSYADATRAATVALGRA